MVRNMKLKIQLNSHAYKSKKAILIFNINSHISWCSKRIPSNLIELYYHFLRAKTKFVSFGYFYTDIF